MAASDLLIATVNYGQVVQISEQLLEICAILGGGALALMKLAGWMRSLNVDVANIHKRLDKVDSELTKQTTILISLGEQGARITNLETQLGIVNQRLNNV